METWFHGSASCSRNSMLYCSCWVRFLWLLTLGIDDKIAEMKYCSTLYCFGWCLHGLFNKAHVFTYVEQVAQCSVSTSLAIEWTGNKYCGPKILLSGKMYRFGASNVWFCFENREILSVILLQLQFLWFKCGSMVQSRANNYDVNTIVATLLRTIGQCSEKYCME